MNNILVSGSYTADINSAKFSYDSSCYYSIVGHALDSVVAIYDGVNTVKIPVSVEAKNAHTGNAVHTYAGIDHVALKNGGQFSLGNGTWIRANSWVDYGDNSDTSHDFSTDDTFNKTRGNNESGYFLVCYTNWGAQKPQTKQWKNYITFKPDSSFNKNYYASLTTLAYKCQADVYATWIGNSGNKQDITADTSDYTVNYKVINYAPLKNLLNSDDLKNTFKTVSANENDYVFSTVSEYYSALAALYNFNLTDGLTVDTVATKANKMKTLISNYNTAKENLKKLPQIEQSYIDSYNNALKEAEAKALNPDNRYTAGSIDALKAEIASVKTARDSVKTNEELEALTKRLLTAISNLVQAKFNVVFVTVGVDSTAETEKFNDYIEYGKTYNADALTNVKKWVVTTDNGNTSTIIDNFDQKASFVITKDAKIYAYLSGEDSSTTSSKVTFLGRHNQVVAIRYVAEGKTLDTTKVDAPSIPFYDFEKWDVASVKGDGNEYTVKASYTCNQVSSDFCTVHFGEWSKAYAYDSYVYLPNTVAGTKYALYSDEQCTKLLTVLDSVDFYAPKTSNIYVKAYDTEATASIAVTGSFAEKDVEAGKNYANFNCKFYLPAGANAIEWGVEVLSPDGTRTAKVKAEKLSERNEYTVRLNTTNSSVTSITGRAYLVYVQDGVKTTIYSPEFVTVNLNA